MWIKWLILVTIITIANGQLPGLGNIGRAITNRGRNIGRNISEVLPNVSIEGEVNLRPGAVSGNGRIILPPRTHPDVDQRTPDALAAIIEKEFGDFKILYNKSYSSPEIEYLRKQNFIANRLSVSRFNQDYSFGLSKFILKLNPFADLLTQEFNSLVNGFRGGNRKAQDLSFPASAYIPPININKPTSIDWRELGGVTSVKHQGMCASCHAFSAAGAVEGHYFRKTGDLLDLSPQNLLDCLPEKHYVSYGCAGGGYVDEDLKYIKENPGIDIEGAYVYEGIDGPCRFREDAVGANITGYVEIPEGDEEALETILATLGPISVGIDASQMTFQFYSQGIYYDENCKNQIDNINHAMLLVGYGEESDGQKYWLIKNSYGPDWGIGGYIKMAKFRNNHCGVASSAIYPLV